MIIVPAGVYNEILLMWKPVRLQGVGAASSVINANTHPAGELKLNDWRRRVNCLFGLALNGTPMTSVSGANPYDPTGTFSCTDGQWNYFKTFDGKNPQVDRLPLEASVGWDATLNGNLAELLQEPTLMGAYGRSGDHGVVQGREVPVQPVHGRHVPDRHDSSDGPDERLGRCSAGRQ